MKIKFIEWAIGRLNALGYWCEEAAERLHYRLPHPPSTMTEAERKLFGQMARTLASESPYVNLLAPK